MKKFYIILISIIVVFSLAMVTLYLLRDDEVLTYATSRLYWNYKQGPEGEEFEGIDREVELNYNVKNKKKKSVVTYTSSDDSVVEVKNKFSGKRSGTGPLVIKKAGEVDITVTLINSRGVETHSFIKTVYIGDGTSESTPFYVYNEEMLQRVGSDPETFSMSANYKQINDIRLTEELETKKGVFSGTYNGMGYTIFNYKKISGAQGDETSAMFEEIGASGEGANRKIGKVGYLIFKEVDINGIFNNASVVAATNRGQIDFVSVYGKIENTKPNGYTAAIANYNLQLAPYHTNNPIAQILRCANYAEITATGGTGDSNYSVIGGIVSENEGYLDCNLTGGNVTLGDETNARTSGNIYLKSGNNIAGGIVGINRITNQNIVASEYLKARPRVADSYVNSTINHEGVGTYLNAGYIGGIIGHNKNISGISAGQENYIFGNYYVAYNGTFAGNLSEQKIYNRGIGNGFSNEYDTKESTESTYDARRFIALGITSVEAGTMLRNTTDILSSASPSTDDRKYMDEKFWNAGVWDIGLNINGDYQFPILKTEGLKYDFTGIFIDMPISKPAANAYADLLIRDVYEYFKYPTSATWRDYRTHGDSQGTGTYYIVDDLDFSELTPSTYNMAQFVDMTSNITGYKLTKEQIDASYLPGFDLPASSGKIKISNLTINAGNLLTTAGMESIGVFSSILSSKISNIIFENITVVGWDGVKNIGLVAGEMKGGSLSNIEIRSSSNAGTKASKIMNDSNTFATVGSVVGDVKGASNLSNIITKDVLINVNLTEGGKLGGVFGNLSNASNVNNVTVEMLKVEQLNITTAAYVGGLAGYITSSTVSSSRITAKASDDAAIIGNSVGGISETAVGSGFSRVEVDLWTSGIASSSNSAGAVVHLYKNTNGETMSNIHTKVRFTKGNAAGFVYTVNSGANVSNVIVENDFNNAGAKYAKTENIPQMEFSGWSKPSSRNYNNTDGKGVAATFTNVFYYNLQGKDDSIKVYTIYNDKGANDEDAGGFLIGWLVPGVKRDRVDWAGVFNSSYGTGRINENGTLTTANQNESQVRKGQAAQNANFSSNIWNNTNAGMPSLNF